MEGMTYKLVSEKLPDNIVESINYEKNEIKSFRSRFKGYYF